MYIFKQESECFIRNPYTEKWAEITRGKAEFSGLTLRCLDV